MLEEMLDGFAGVFGNVINILNVIPSWVTGWDGNDLGITAAIVGHVKHPDWPGRKTDTGKERVLGQNKDIDGVAIQTQGMFKKPVVGGVNKVCVEHAVKENPTRFVVNFILVAAPARDFNDGGVFGHGFYSFGESFVK
jgi:hypothetical protein|tara:strand:- start:3448 stop:3861 length:414 start_codon:yes stop_codon:yes gene_type:complete